VPLRTRHSCRHASQSSCVAAPTAMAAGPGEDAPWAFLWRGGGSACEGDRHACGWPVVCFEDIRGIREAVTKSVLWAILRTFY